MITNHVHQMSIEVWPFLQQLQGPARAPQPGPQPGPTSFDQPGLCSTYLMAAAFISWDEFFPGLLSSKLSMDWFKGKSTGNHGFYHQIQGFPVKFPIIQFYETTLWYTNIAIENGPVEIVDLPIKNLVIFHGYVNVYQRVP